MSAFQAEETGSIPVTRSKDKQSLFCKLCFLLFKIISTLVLQINYSFFKTKETNISKKTKCKKTSVGLRLKTNNSLIFFNK